MIRFPEKQDDLEIGEDEDDSVPLFGRWRNAYFAIGTFFLLEVGLFYFVSHYFA